MQNLFRDSESRHPLSLISSEKGFQFLKNFKGLSLRHKRIALIGRRPIMLRVRSKGLAAYQET